MYREIRRTNAMREATLYGLAVTRRSLEPRKSAAPPLSSPQTTATEEPEALFAALSLGALVIITLISLLQAWL
jgi:hypothetical protein